jgi:hypothetical protein
LKTYVGTFSTGSAGRKAAVPAENQHGFDFSST